ncbi:MAG: hypothetical protein ACXVDJ_07505 [Tumebacillaceae bacterium]
MENQRSFSRKFRRPRANLSPYIINNLYIRNPFMVLWWSAAFPGCGHFMLCKFFQGSMLFIWEILVNTKAHINEALLLSFTGQFAKAREVLDERWLLLYVAVYLFALWDAYRLTIVINEYAYLAEREKSPIVPVNLSALEIGFLQRLSPWVAVFWSLFTPGLGQLYANILPSGFFVLIWNVVTAYNSHLLQAIHLTFLGDFHAARDVLDVQWVLFYPSIYGFALCDSYFRIIEYNRLFKTEQANYLRTEYQDISFQMPL